MDLATEQQLVINAKTDFSSFDKLYTYYFPKVFGFVKSKIYDNKQAEDLVSEIFIKILNGLPRYEWQHVPFGAWIFTIARNHLKDFYSKNNRQPASIDLSEFQIADNDNEKNPLVKAHMNELQRTVLSELAKLPEREKEVVRLKYFSGLRNTEIAASLGLSERNVAVILFRSLKKLKGPLSQLTK